MRKVFSLTVFVALFLLACASLYAANVRKVTVFHSLTCHECIEAKNTIIPAIEKEFGNSVVIEYRDVADIENYKYFLGLKEKYKSDIEFSLPVFYCEGRFLNSKSDLGRDLRKMIAQAKGVSLDGDLVRVDLLERFKQFRPLAIISAGLVDGINPCAFTVIVFFISFLALQGYRRRELIVIGLTFICSVFLTYLVLGLGLFNFLYAFKGFWIVTKAINFGVGIFTIVLGFAALYDLYKFRKTGQAEGMVLQLPEAVKKRIHKVVGMHYRKTSHEKETRAQRHVLALAVTALITGFLVSLLEAVCTGQLYVPTIAFILKSTPFKLQAFSYLVLYNFMFVVPLFIIFLSALFGVTSTGFSGFLRKHMSLIKFCMAIIFFGLGFLLIWRG